MSKNTSKIVMSVELGSIAVALAAALFIVHGLETKSLPDVAVGFAVLVGSYVVFRASPKTIRKQSDGTQG